MATITNRALRGMATAFVLAVAGALCSASLAQTTLRIVPQADLKILDPVQTTNNITSNHGYMIFDVLVALDEKLQPKPQMVEGWEKSADGLTWKFKLRPGLKFHDGTPVTSKEAVLSIQLYARLVARYPNSALGTQARQAVEAQKKKLVIPKAPGPAAPG